MTACQLGIFIFLYIFPIENHIKKLYSSYTRHDDDQIITITEGDDPFTEELVAIVDENGAIVNDTMFKDIIVEERENRTDSNENESVENNAESLLDWSKYRPTMLRTKKKKNC